MVCGVRFDVHSRAKDSAALSSITARSSGGGLETFPFRDGFEQKVSTLQESSHL